MDFHTTLDYVSTVGYDVDFLRDDGARKLLDLNPIVESMGAEHFDPQRAPPKALAATGPWAARLLQGGGTIIEGLAGGTTWSGSLDLPGSASQVSNIVRQWLERELSNETELISRAGSTFPMETPIAEQFYSLRDSIHFSEQWLPGSPSSRPALTLLLAFCIGVDEFFCAVDTLDTTKYLGRQIGELWDECAAECGGREDAVKWLALARSALRSSVFLQNREKLVHLGLITEDKHIFADWDTTAHYMLRAEAAMTPFVGFCLCAYTGLPFTEQYIGSVGIYCYGNAFVLDFCKRSTRLGGGNYTEVSLENQSSELQGRSHLIGSLLAYGESVLPPLFLCVLRPYVMATSSVVDVLDRYRERSWGRRLPVGNETLWMMEVVMKRAGAILCDKNPAKSSVSDSLLANKVLETNDAWDAYKAYMAHPSVDGLYRLPRAVRLLLQFEKTESHKPISNGGYASGRRDFKGRPVGMVQENGGPLALETVKSWDAIVYNPLDMAAIKSVSDAYMERWGVAGINM
ncbi:hypothetical protein MY11210_009162 [Beauveria gryllotalpidicola]